MKKILLFFALSVMAFASPCETRVNYDRDTEATLGTLVGGIVGGVIGHRFGKGKGKTVATIGGSVVGALLGQKIARTKGKRCDSAYPKKKFSRDCGRGHGKKRRYRKTAGHRCAHPQNGHSRPDRYMACR